MLSRSYPKPTMEPVPEVLVEAFLAERASDSVDSNLSDLEEQRVYALYVGARQRAMTTGVFRTHSEQAAALLMLIDELQGLLDGSLSVGGREGFLKKLDDDEMRPLKLLAESLPRLLDWHFQNGAGRLLPIADWLGLVVKEQRA